MSALKRYGGELIVLIGLFVISMSFKNIFIPIMATILAFVGCYNLVQMYIVNKEIKSSDKQMTNEEKLSIHREKELLHNLVKRFVKGS